METSTSYALEIEDLTVAYKDIPVLWDLDLNIPEGVLAAIVGPNGAGKTTLIRTVLGMIKPAAGKIFILGKPYHKQRKRIGYVPQRNSVDWDFPTNVLDVVMMGLYGQLGWVKQPGRRERELARDALKKVGMETFEKRQIGQLSGGQQQRIFLARAMVQNADLYFMDEPLQGVDATTEKAIFQILKDFKNQGKTIVVVHHDLQTLAEYFDWIAMINVRMIANGLINEVFTQENIGKTYGGRISFVAEQQQ